MIIFFAILNAIYQSDQELWPVGYFDIAGEMSYTQAAKTLGLKLPSSSLDIRSLLKKLEQDPANVVLWKMVVDKYVTASNWSLPLPIIKKISTGTLNRSRISFENVETSCNFAMMSVQYRWSEASYKLDGKSKEDWQVFLRSHDSLKLLNPDSHPSKINMITRLSSYRGSPLEWRSMIKSFEGKIDCRYFLQYSLAESYLFGEAPANPKGGSKAIPIGVNQSIAGYKKAYSDFPKEPTPRYKLASLMYPKDPISAKKYANEYLALERRDCKSRWIQKMKGMAK